jgi:hypothetical protein
MIANGREQAEHFEMSSPPAWAETWHLWTVLMPRRSISGKLVFGQVWRRRTGRKWEYKKFLKYQSKPRFDRLDQAD